MNILKYYNAICFIWIELSSEFLELNFRSSFTIRVGSSQRYQGGDVYNLDAIHIHPSFNRTIPYNCDIAVVKLSSDLEFSSAIGPIKLPKMCPSSLVGKIGTVSGWGRTAVRLQSTYYK